MYEPGESEAITQLKQENAALKLRVQRLELYLELYKTAPDSQFIHTIEGRIRMLEMSTEWRAIQPEKIL